MHRADAPYQSDEYARSYHQGACQARREVRKPIYPSGPVGGGGDGSHNGLNIVGATEILRDYKFYYSSHPSKEGMKAHHVGGFLDRLMGREQGKEVYIIWDNSPTHKAIAEEYERKYRGRLHLLFLPPYSPEFDPQENIWCWLKTYCARNRAYSTVKELSAWIGKFQVYTYNTPSRVRKRVDARLYFKKAA